MADNAKTSKPGDTVARDPDKVYSYKGQLYGGKDNPLTVADLDALIPKRLTASEVAAMRTGMSGAPVPNDVLNATVASRGGAEQEREVGDEYDSLSRDELEDEAKSMGIFASIKGSGANGSVLKADLLSAIRAHEAGK